MSYILELRVKSRYGGTCTAGELGIPVKQTGAFLPAGASARWEL
jgi:23S rRNA (cytosine1962-C5)-methyltransferase